MKKVKETATDSESLINIPEIYPLN